MDVASVQITREKCPRMRDKIGCRDELDQNLQNFSESFGNSNIIRNTMGKHQRVINRVVHCLFHKKLSEYFVYLIQKRKSVL